jgi:hypothetical protein
MVRAEQNKGIDSLDNKNVRVDSDVTLTSDTEWKEWLSAREDNALKVYTLKPEQLVADQRREQGISRDYKGREILELLQNAADAAKKAEQRGRIRIELSPTGLIVANTGASFSIGGVRSLQTADLSPKRKKNSSFIGSKGLGFRSVLNWSRHPVILSGSLQIAYSSSYAHELLTQLKQRNTNVSEELIHYQSTGKESVPLLPFPVNLDRSEQHTYVEDAALFERCKILKGEGYETVIGMPFERQSSFVNALSQINLLRPEFLLFSEAIELLSISVITKVDSDNWEKQWCSKIVSDTVVEIAQQDKNSGLEECQNWTLYRQTGNIPTKMLRDSDDPDSYNLAIALRVECLAVPANLHSFFPTSIPMPLHALCHASLELEQNRKHLQDSEVNSFVLRKLALLLADKIEQQIEDSGDPHRALDLIAPESLLSNYQADIQVLQEVLIEALKTRKILPTLSGVNLTVEEVLSFPSEVTCENWLPKNIFPNVVIARNDLDKRMFDCLGVEIIKPDQFINLLKSATNITIVQRASIVLGIINKRLKGEYCYKGLLLDTQGNELSEDDSVYLPGGSLNEILVLPAWAKVKILNDELWSLLRGNKVRDSAKALSVFDVHEYALGNLIAGLVSSANAAVEILDENKVRSELLKALFTLFNMYQNEDERPDFPKRLTVCLLNQIGEWKGTNQLYFGEGYTSSGNIVARLYKSVPEKLIVESSVFETMGLMDSSLSQFFSWLGIVEWPRLVVSKKFDTTFLGFVKKHIKYPAVFSESTTHIFESPKDLPTSCQLSSVLSLDAIDAILSSEHETILSWLANDSRAASWLKSEENNGTLCFYPHRAVNQRIYRGDLPSFIHWKIKYSCWLRSTDGEKRIPVDCMVNDVAVSGIFPQPVLPSNIQMKGLGLTPILLRLAWLNAGVREGIEDFESEEVYALLSILPDKDPSGKLAKKLYNWLIKTVNFNLDENGENYLNFVKHGCIYAKYGDAHGYFPIVDSYHVDVEGFPQELLKSLRVASLLKKRGAEKVRRLFGIKVLDKEFVDEKVIQHRAVGFTEMANQHFQQSKKYIEIYRHSHFSKAPGRVIFDQLQLTVCEQVKSQITFNDKTIDNLLPPWSYSIQGKMLYICCSSHNPNSPFNPLLANTIGDAVASIFGLNDGDSFSKIYQCDEDSRAELLGKMLGDELDGDLDIMLKGLIEEANEQKGFEPVVSMGPIPSAPIVPPVNSSQPNQHIQSTSLVNAPKLPNNEWNIPAAIGAESVEHVPSVPGTHVGIRVTGQTSSGGSGGNSSSGGALQKSNGRAGEELARLFEESQGRFPLEVWHITGSETIAADILSFRSAEDRSLFTTGKDQSSALIERIIEAKEKRKGGAVLLTVNEVNTAAKWKEKYYIYRFTPMDAAEVEYQLKILCNPLAQITAVVSSIEISLDAATTSQQFRIFEQKKAESNYMEV